MVQVAPSERLPVGSSVFSAEPSDYPDAGSAMRLNRSQNRRSGLSVAHWCSLVWIFSTLASASSSGGQGAPTFTGDLLTFQRLCCWLAGSLCHVHSFPVLGLLRTLRPTLKPSADSRPAHPHPDKEEGRATPRRFPRSPHADRRGRRPALPLQLRHEYAADIPRSLPTDCTRSASESLPTHVAGSVHCSPAHIHQIGAGITLEGVQPLVHFRYAFPSR